MTRDDKLDIPLLAEALKKAEWELFDALAAKERAEAERDEWRVSFYAAQELAIEQCAIIAEDWDTGIAAAIRTLLPNGANAARVPRPTEPAKAESRWVAVPERTENDNFFTSIYENDYKGLLVARCNQNGSYPWQAAAIIRGLEKNKELPTNYYGGHHLWPTDANLATEPAKAEERSEAAIDDGNRPLPFERDELGRMVREAWVRWATVQPDPKPSWLIPYEQLPESDKEADRQIGEAVARWTLIGDAARDALSHPTAEPAKAEEQP